MTAADIHNWVAIYLATFMLAVVAAFLAATTVAVELIRERFWRSLNSPKDWLLFAPRVWWRWQKRYLLGTPMILLMVGIFAANLDWGQG
jgi:hypothetical protein